MSQINNKNTKNSKVILSSFILFILVTLPAVSIFIDFNNSIKIALFIIACFSALFFINIDKISEISAKIPGKTEITAKTRILETKIEEAEQIKHYLGEIAVFSGDAIVRQSFPLRVDAGGRIKPKLDNIIELRNLFIQMENETNKNGITNRVFKEERLDKLLFDYIEIDLTETIGKEMSLDTFKFKEKIKQEKK